MDSREATATTPCNAGTATESSELKIAGEQVFVLVPFAKSARAAPFEPPTTVPMIVVLRVPLRSEPVPAPLSSCDCRSSAAPDVAKTL